MNEGEQLKSFIDNQSKSKISIAKDLKMSKQNLFGLFKSKTLGPETKEKMEAYFGKKIFTAVAGGEKSSTVNIDHSVKGDSETDLKKAVRELSESAKFHAESAKLHTIIEDRNSKNIERLITLLEMKLGAVPMDLPEPGSPHTVQITRRQPQKKKTGH